MEKTLKNFLALLLLALLGSACSHKTQAVVSPPPLANNYAQALEVGAQTLNVDIARDTKSMEQGLSGRQAMAENQGMLFDFGGENLPGFWMKDMKFNLDFIWIDKNKIIGITPDVPAPSPGVADSSLRLYSPPSPVNWVLEVNAGWTQKNKIKVGDSADLVK